MGLKERMGKEGGMGMVDAEAIFAWGVVCILTVGLGLLVLSWLLLLVSVIETGGYGGCCFGRG